MSSCPRLEAHISERAASMTSVSWLTHFLRPVTDHQDWGAAVGARLGRKSQSDGRFAASRLELERLQDGLGELDQPLGWELFGVSDQKGSGALGDGQHHLGGEFPIDALEGRALVQ